MSELTTTQNPTPEPEAAFVTLRSSQGAICIETNLPPEARPLVLWMLEQAKITILTQPSEQEKSKLVTPPTGNGFRKDFLKKMRP